MSRDDRVDPGAGQLEAANASLARTWTAAAAAWPRLAAGGERFAHAVAGTFEREMEAGRGFLWLPVCFGAGILVYFVLPQEPWLPALVGLAAVAFSCAILSRSNASLFRLTVVLTALATGLLVAKVRTDTVAAPVMPRAMTAAVTGWIARTEQTATGGKRVRLHVAAIEDMSPAETPVNVRVTVRSGADDLAVGDAITVLANLDAPGGPVIPGGYDFSFFPFYERIGGVGFAYGAARPADLGAPPWSVALRQPLEHLRDDIRRRIEAALPGDYGHIAAALVMGDQRGIAESTHEAMRASGLGHILSISGLHMALVAGSVFWLLRALLALSPTLALHYPIKKWAAGGAFAVATFYLGISGAEVATVRSYVMLVIMLVAIMLDRRALTLRNVALAALVILLFSPESLLSISFQMSFAATVALIAAYEALSDRVERRLVLTDARDRTWMGRAGASIGTLFLTSLVAGLATAPFGAFYFQRVAPLTILANMAAAPAVAAIVMPMALLSVVVMPFGLEAVPLAIMQWGLWWMVTVAEVTAAWSEGWGGIRALPAVCLLFLVVGLLWLALWRERWRFLGIVPLVAAIPLALAAPRPLLIVDEDATAVAIRGPDGRLGILGGRGADFEVEAWLRSDADIRPVDAPDLHAGRACDQLGCIGSAVGLGTVAFVLRREAFAEDCRAAEVVITRLAAPPACSLHAVVIDRGALRRYGAHAFYPDGTGYAVRTTYPPTRRLFMPPAGE